MTKTRALSSKIDRGPAKDALIASDPALRDRLRFPHTPDFPDAQIVNIDTTFGVSYATVSGLLASGT